MAVSDVNSIYYEIVIEAKGAIQTLQELSGGLASFDAMMKQSQGEIEAVMTQYGVSATVAASVIKKALADINAAEVDNIKNSQVMGETTEQQSARISAALELQKEKYIALNAAIDQASKNIQAPAGAAVPVTPFPPEVLANYEALVKDVQSATLAMSQMQAAGASNKDMQMALGDSMATLASKYKVELPIIADLFKQMGVNVNLTDEQIQAMATRAAQMQLKGNIQEAQTALEGASGAGREFANVLRMIEGVAVAMVIFQVFQTISQAIRDATDNANKYYLAMQNIIVAQDTLARSGVQTTNQQLLDMADQLSQKFQITKADMTQTVSQAALLTANYGFSVDQIKQISTQAAILYQLDPSKPAAEYVVQLVKALEGSRSLAANNEQIAITATQIKDKAIELGLIGENYKGTLSDQVKMQASLAIEAERLLPEADALAKTAGSDLDTQRQLNKAWGDTSELLGRAINPFIDEMHVLLVSILQIVQDNLNQALNLILTVMGVIDTEIVLYAKVWEAIKEASQGHFEQLKALPALWGEANAAAMKYLTTQFYTGGMNLNQNTPASPVTPGANAQEPDLSKVNNYLDSVAKDYQSYYDGVQKAQENFNTKMQDLQDQYNLNVQKEVENTNLRMAEEKQNYRLKELKAEEDFQQKMRDLTARYLLDLEDALRKRDAEAVIKTIERYNMEKNSAQQQEDLRISQDKKAEALRLSQMKAEEELRLQQMAEEYALQQQKAKQAYDQQLKDLSTSLETKLQEEAAKIAQEYGMNQAGMDALLNLFNQYYGPDGSLAKSQQGAFDKMIEQSGPFLEAMKNIMTQYFNTLGTGMSALGSIQGTLGNITTEPTLPPSLIQGTLGNITTEPPSPPPTTPHHQAQGGMALAASATDVTFGEAGPELAMFLSLNSSTSIPALGTTLGAGGQFGGQAVIALQVDPNLEARIVNTTLTHAAISIEKVYRTG